MRRFKSPGQAQRFLSVHGLVRNLFHVGRHLVRPSRFSPEVRERAVRMVEEHQEAHASEWAVLTCLAIFGRPEA